MQQDLTLSPEQMRALGYQIVDWLIEHQTTLPTQRVANLPSRAVVEPGLREPIPQTGSDPDAVLAQLRRDVFAHISHVDHPRFFAFIPSPGNFVGAMADALIAGMNVFAGTWIESAGPAIVEDVVVDWLRQLAGMPKGAGGLAVSGGSMANLTALATARHARLNNSVSRAVIYYSDQTHASIDRALKVLGFGPEQVRRIPSCADFRIDVGALQAAITADRAAGHLPFCVVANAGTTNTGAVDHLDALADLCATEGLWLHADGAYGAAAIFCDQGQAALHGLGRVDSLSLDPHKWLFQPYELACVLVRDRRMLKDAFHYLPEYMQDTVRPEVEEINFCDYGIQLTRNFRILKLWMSLKIYGFEAFSTAVAHGFHLAEYAETVLRTMPDWEITSAATMAIVSFRYAPPSLNEPERNVRNRQVVHAINADGFAMLSTTLLRGRTVIRLCPINPRTTEDDVHSTLHYLDALARKVG